GATPARPMADASTTARSASSSADRPTKGIRDLAPRSAIERPLSAPGSGTDNRPQPGPLAHFISRTFGSTRARGRVAQVIGCARGPSTTPVVGLVLPEEAVPGCST